MTIADRFIGRFRFGSVRFTAGTHSQFNNDYNNNINVVASPHVIYIYRHAHSATLKRERFYFSMLYTLFKGNTRRTIIAPNGRALVHERGKIVSPPSTQRTGMIHVLISV